jgi:hypothetical protein
MHRAEADRDPVPGVDRGDQQGDPGIEIADGGRGGLGLGPRPVERRPEVADVDAGARPTPAGPGRGLACCLR